VRWDLVWWPVASLLLPLLFVTNGQPSLLPLLQLQAAEQQLSALTVHIDAVMVGYAVRALQASKKSSAEQHAIQQLAAREQAEVKE